MFLLYVELNHFFFVCVCVCVCVCILFLFWINCFVVLFYVSFIILNAGYLKKLPVSFLFILGMF